MGIRNRLLALLVVPLVGLLAVTGYAMFDAVGRSKDASELSADARVGLASYRLVDALQAERQVLAAGQPSNAGLRSAVREATLQLSALGARQGGDLAAATAEAVERVRAVDGLAATNTGGLVAVDGFSPPIEQLLDVSRSAFDPGGSIDERPAATTDLLARAQEAAAHERDLVQALSRRGELVPARYGAVAELASSQAIRSAQAASSAPEDLAVRINRVGDSIAAAARSRDQLFFDPAAGTAASAALDSWTKAADTRVSDLQTLRDSAAGRAVAAVDALGARSRTVMLLSTAAVIAVLLISAWLTRSAVRSIARPLHELAAQADEVARIRLPEAVSSQQAGGAEVHLPTIRASGAAEVQEVAQAFNDVQDTALHLAGEQAVLRRNLAEALSNLGRRNQVLLGRQLDFISSLEQRETDPAFLEHLFKLDHLASRMRRNAESLLVLTGSETPRRRRTPAPLGEVVRAAMSEVEDFERVRLGHLGDATITGPVVIDLVHMLAELIENALRFSPPDSTVEIDGRPLQGGYQLAVTDHGVGMAEVELVAANQRLAGLDEVDGMPTRYLGQYVIAKLGAKTGAMVRLQATAGGRGVTAVLSLPAAAIVGGADRSSIARPLPGTRAARDQGPDPFAPGAGLVSTLEQPDAVIDPSADPFADPAPDIAQMSDDAPSAASEDWGWTPEVIDTPAATARGVGDAFSAEDFAVSMFAAETFDAEPLGDLSPPPPPESVPEQAWSHATPEPTPEPAPEPGAETGDGGGGLARRVPGASLQASPLSSATSDPSPVADRSADGVRSMLSAFQSGRSRGQVDRDVVVVDRPIEQMDEHLGAATAPEMEEPRDD